MCSEEQRNGMLRQGRGTWPAADLDSSLALAKVGSWKKHFDKAVILLTDGPRATA